MLTFTVFGVAQSKGSMTAYVPRGMKFPIVTESNRKAKAWAQLVAEGASRALGQQLEPKILTTPIRVTIAFYLPRPKKYQRRGLAVANTKKPDIDRLLRSVLDALTEVLYLDDAQVAKRHPFDRPLVVASVQPDMFGEPARVVEHIDTAVSSSHFATCPHAATHRRPRQGR